jgi:CheY-like chemotaxis protein
MKRIVLVIDDDQDDREFFREALFETDKNTHYIGVSNGLAALELLNKPGDVLPDLIFLDLNMPRMDGRECLIRLRQLRWLKAIPIIIFTTSSFRDGGAEYVQLGADLCVTKPLVYKELKEKIRYIMEELPARLKTIR